MNGSIETMRQKIAVGCRILAMEGLVDEILGHISVRLSGDEMLIRCRSPLEQGVAYTQIDAVQHVTFDGDGAEDGYHVPKELSIHTEVYRARPDVGCVIHAHPPAALLCGISELEFKPIFGAFNIPAMRLAVEGIPIFPHAYLITRPELASGLIEAMGNKNVCLMKGHGITVTGETVEDTVVRALNFNALAKITLDAAMMGRNIVPISDEDLTELPDLGQTFNAEWVWRFYARKLAHWEGRNFVNPTV
ncbi:class II aldolase/adducin family protein [Alicyclobacillus dauci]|uniref:Class II aldolase/adducin family protein n=1 Tax=Alicyclobacillus dauci TaxID=1475485 RepID=A0ABY6YZY3_9BACL|nr:class II aldolase/adducin family protein [Alicyclobacillus dauci]WAH35639.1 class II aldolase/adducin family protein [Alicyclobacillus dauci]